MSEYNREQGRDLQTTTPSGGMPGQERWDEDPNRPRESVQEEYRQEMGQKAEEAREKAAEYGEKAREGAERGREQAAEGMQKAASSLRERTEGRGGMAGDLGSKAADRMEGASTYLREHNTQEMMQDVEKYVREHPAQSVLGAVFAGFLIGRILR